MSFTAYDSYCCFRNKKNEGYRLLWELTTRCNQNCSFCHVKKANELNINEIETIFERLSEIKINDIIFTGGEPLLRKDLFDILKMAKTRHYEIDLCTNGTLIDDNISSELRDYLSEISVSIDGPNADINDNIRGLGFEKTITGIRSLVRNNHSVHLISVVTQKNYKQITDIANLAETLGAHSLTFLGLVKGYSSNVNEGLVLALKPEEIDNVRSTITNLRKENRTVIINSKRIFPKQPLEVCRAGSNILGLTADGILLQCILHKNGLKLDLKNHSISKDNLSEFIKISEHNICFDE